MKKLNRCSGCGRQHKKSHEKRVRKNNKYAEGCVTYEQQRNKILKERVGSG